MQQRVEVHPAEVVQVDPVQPAVPPHAGDEVGDRFAGPDGRDQEDRLLLGQVPEQGQRHVVEQRDVVGDGDQATAFVPAASARRVSSNKVTMWTCPSGPGRPIPPASRPATAPSGSSEVVRLPTIRSVGKPVAAACAAHSSASRVLPTPARP